MAIGVAEVQLGLGRVVQLVGGQIVAQHVAAVVGEPQFLGARIPVESHRVSNAARERFVARAASLEPRDGRVARGIRIADVARRADGDVEPAVRAEPNELPAVVRFAGIAVGDDCGFGPRAELRFDIVEAQDAVHFGDIERAVAQGHAVRHTQARGERDDLRGFRVAVAHRVDSAAGLRADEEHVVLAQRQRARVGNAVGEDADLEAGGKLDAFDRQALRQRRLSEDERDARASRARSDGEKISFHGSSCQNPDRHINKRFGKCSESMKLSTWNIQWWRGCDGRVDPARIARVASAMADFDVLCLQEVASNYPDLAGSSGENQYEALAGLLPDHTVVKGVATDVPAPRGDRREFGNAIVTRLPVLQVFRRLLPWPADRSVPSMQRSAVEAVLESPSGPLRVTTTHLEYYSAKQRAAQVGALRELQREAAGHAAAPVPAREGPFRTMPRPASGILTADFNFPPDVALHRHPQSQPATGVPAFRTALPLP